jgi:hypothetical protein
VDGQSWVQHINLRCASRWMVREGLLVMAAVGLLVGGRPAVALTEKVVVAAPPAEVVEGLHLKPFYKKYVSAQGFPVLSSEKVSDYALLEAAYLINQMLDGHEDIRQALIRNKVRFVVMASTELTTMVPEHSDLTPSKYWDKRARGLGSTPSRPAVSCGEENLLNYPGDPYNRENILIHEFSHAIHEMGLRSIDKTFDPKLKAAYDHAMANGLWKGFYASTNRSEYWAEGVQSWFDCNHNVGAGGKVIATRQQLIEYDPELAKLVESVFGNKPWRYQRPDQRKEKAHLEGYDPSKAPRFSWPPELVQWYREYEQNQKKKDP